jgi:hypothetical protein
METRALEAEARIDAFLAAVRDGTNGSGWNLLRNDVRASYPGGGEAWVAAITSADTSGLTWTVDDVVVDDYVGCARVEFGEARADVPLTLYDARLPAQARVATSLSSGPFHICVTVGPLPIDAGIHGAG